MLVALPFFVGAGGEILADVYCGLVVKICLNLAGVGGIDQAFIEVLGMVGGLAGYY
jgi:hypothetical protein